MEILQDHDLKAFNTFGVSAHAKFFTEIKQEADIKELFTLPEFKNNNKLFLGGGSNVLFTKDFDGMVILNALKGITIVEDNVDDVFVHSMGGEIWHDLVMYAVAHGYWGIENLSLIPGTAGAAPMQNIGAYGVELKDSLETVETYDVATAEKKIFTNQECQFGYRDSIFKNIYKDKYFISAITLRLQKIPQPKLSYKILSEFLTTHNIAPTDLQGVSDAVANIRRSKLPDPKVIGNAGSFFKNVFVPKEKLKELQTTYPEMPFFEEEDVTKIPAGWLIESCGWNGYRKGSVGVHDRQALVIVNHGGATGKEIKALADEIIASVFSKFGLQLQTEVNVI